MYDDHRSILTRPFTGTAVESSLLGMGHASAAQRAAMYSQDGLIHR